MRQLRVELVDLETKSSGEVLLVAEHHVDKWGDPRVHRLCLCLAADR